MSRQLILVRHAKTQPMADSDRERELTERGRRQAEALGVMLGELALGSARVLVSAAVRARQTWELAAGEIGPALPEEEVVEALYDADPDRILDEVRRVPGEVETVIVVGHNPTVEDLVHGLAGNGRGEAYDALSTGGYSACTATVFEVAGSWAGLDADAAALTRYLPPGA